MESPGQRDHRTLRAEAERIREQVRALKCQRRDDPNNSALLEEYQRLQNRYQRIERALKEGPPPAPQQHAPPPFIDPALLEPRKPVAPPRPPQRGMAIDGERIYGFLLTGVRTIRVSVTAVLILFILAFAYLYFVQDMRFFIVPTRSMQPTLYPMDRIMTIKAAEYQRGDIIVFPDPDHPGDYLAKRVVAITGDTVAVNNRVLLVNNNPVPEPYIAEPMEYTLAPFIVPFGQVFVLGDNRNASEDSKDWEQGVAVDNIRGRVALVYMPFDRFRRVARQGVQTAGL